MVSLLSEKTGRMNLHRLVNSGFGAQIWASKFFCDLSTVVDFLLKLSLINEFRELLFPVLLKTIVNALCRFVFDVRFVLTRMKLYKDGGNATDTTQQLRESGFSILREE